MKRIINILIILCSIAITANATTAAKGVFSVAANKKVQFANANSIYSENDLIQWANLGAATDAGWDVLTSAEWTYLLITRDGEGSSKNNLGKVNGQNGMIILPDEWTQPEGTTYAASPQEYKTNQYTTEEWTKMANAGAIFLPCAGYGYEDGSGYHVEDATDHGAYWAKNEVSEGSANACCIKFNEVGAGGSIHDFTNAVKTNYYSVILVRDATILNEEDEADDYNTHWTLAKGKSSAYVNRTLRKDSTLYTLCLPFDVPNIDDSPLAGAEIFEFKGGNVSGTTGNETLRLNLSRLVGKRLTQGVPYLLRWNKTNPVETLAQPLYFENVENWDTDTETATDPGNTTVKLHGVYPKAAIPGYTSGSVAHYNFFLGANNTLYWPDNTTYAGHMMKGFRAYFYITPGGGPSSAPIKRGMQVVWEIGGTLETPTGIQNTEYNTRAEKFLRDGQIILVIDGKEYDLQGKKIK